MISYLQEKTYLSIKQREPVSSSPGVDKINLGSQDYFILTEITLLGFTFEITGDRQEQKCTK